jgi:glutaminase
MHRAGRSGPVVFRSTTAAARPSSRTRPGDERDALAADAGRIAIVAAQGDLEFAAAENLLYSIEQALAGPASQWLVLDLQRVTRLHPAAAHLLDAHLTHLLAHDVAVAIVQPLGRLLLPSTSEFNEPDEAVAWCEDALLAGRATRGASSRPRHASQKR